MSTAWISLKLTPLDTLFFREPRPFTAAEQTEARSVFPPTALTLQGMLRSRLLATHAPRALGDRQAPLEPSVAAVVGELGGAPGSLRLRGPWLLREGQWLLPTPADVVFRNENHGKADPAERVVQADRLRPVEDEAAAGVANYPGRLRPLTPPAGWAHFGGAGGWLAWDAYAAYLAGQPFELRRRHNWFQADDLWDDETRPGVGINPKTNAAQEHLLYFAHHVRPRPGVTLGIQAGGLGALASPAGQIAALGGEARAVSIENTTDPPWQNSKPPDGARFKLVLTQPAWFERGYRPEWMDPGGEDRDATATCNGATAAWRSARIERPSRLGGWDLVNGRPKPMRAFVQAGSVYYFEAAGGPRAFGRFHDDDVVTDRGDEAFDQLGCGHALVGAW